MNAIEGMSAISCGAEKAAATSPYPHIVDWPACAAGKCGAVKFGVLAELGRAVRECHPDVVKLMADRVNEALGDGGWRLRGKLRCKCGSGELGSRRYSGPPMKRWREGG